MKYKTKQEFLKLIMMVTAYINFVLVVMYAPVFSVPSMFVLIFSILNK